MIPYGKQSIDESDIDAVCKVLRSNWLTTGPKVQAFEQKLAQVTGTGYGVAVNSGTAALHTVMAALKVGPGDEVIVPPITFAATANAVLYQGGVPVFADVEPSTLLIDPEKVKEKITGKTRAVIAVDYAGQMCDYDRLRQITAPEKISLVADACHSLGGEYKNRPSGSCADLSVFSFHPVKHITTGEGGMVVTDNKEYAEKMKQFRNHGITSDHHSRSKKESWYYEINEIGFNYRLTDFQCALGLSQIEKLPGWIEKRNQIARQYDTLFETLEDVTPLKTHADNLNAYHLYVIELTSQKLQNRRKEIFLKLRSRGIGVNVHYIPAYYHPLYQNKLGLGSGLCPVAENAYERIISLPMFPGMREKDIHTVFSSVVDTIKEINDESS